MDTKKIKEIFAGQILLIKPSEKELCRVAEITAEFSALLNSELKKAKIKAEAFVGGSLAKDTIIRKTERYDIDVFVRFDYSRYKEKSNQLSELLAKVLEKIAKKGVKIKRIHGSRDYFNLIYKNTFIEIVPILEIKKASQALNITDISPLHVSYVINKVSKNKKLADEIRLAKTFCYVQGCYGAESYIRGFSGYSLEVLCIYFGSFLNLLKAAAKWNPEKKIIIDPAKHYKNKNDVLVLLNESKLISPLILIDPVQKERNVTAALSSETFLLFLKSAHDFMKKPSNESFKVKIDMSLDLKKIAKAKKAEFCTFVIESISDRLDIAGAKSLRLANFLINLMKKTGFAVLESKFFFDIVKNKGFLHVIYKKPLAKLEISGPPIEMKKHADSFKAKYGKTFSKKGKIFAIIARKVRNPEDLLKELRKYSRETKEMLIKKISIEK